MKKSLLNLKIAVVTLGVFFATTASADFTAVASGAWSSSTTWGGTAPSLTVTGLNITIPSGFTVTLDADVTFSGLLKAITVNGVLTSTTTNAIMITQGDLAGSGTITVGKIMFSLLGTASFAGTLNLKHMTNNTSSSLAFVSIANISDTLELESGNLVLNTNSNLTMNSGSTVKVSNGSISLSSGVFNSGNAYNVMYTGSSKTSGIELNSVTLQNLYVNMSSNTQKITLSNNMILNGTLNLNTGQIYMHGKKLTLRGDFVATNAGTSIDSDNSSNLDVEGTGSLTSTFMFAPGASMNDFTVNKTSSGQVKLGSALSVAGHLNLIEGNFSSESGGSLTMVASSTVHVEKGTLSLNTGTFVGTAAYNVEYMGSTDATSGIELSGTGLNNVTVNYLTGTNKTMLNSNTNVGGKLQLMNGKLDLNGKILALNGSLSQKSTAVFIGSTSSELDLNMNTGNGDTLYFDNTSAGSQSLGKLSINFGTVSTIALGSKLIISNELAFVKGKIELVNADLEISPVASITGYDNTKYVVTSDNNTGVLIMNVVSGSAYVTFPVGLSANYSPAYIQQTSSGATGNFSARCLTLTTMGMLKAVNRTWLVESVGTTSINANLKFGWMTSAEVNGFDRTNAYVSHFTSSAWDVTTASSATAGANSTFELSRMGLTSLSPFAVVQSGEPLKVPEYAKAMGIELYPNPSKDVLHIKIMDATNDYKYELIDVTGRTIIETSNNNTINRFDVSGLGSGCYFMKVTNLGDKTTSTQRFIKQ